MTVRQTTDCYLTPPCAALALRRWLDPRCGEVLDRGRWLDPFAGAGRLLHWVVGAHVGALIRSHAFELERRWLPELTESIGGSRVRLCDSMALADWSVHRGEQPHIVTNPPYGVADEALARLHAHARTHHRWVAALTRTDWWQHPERDEVRPDHLLMLAWRPAFGFRREKKTGKVVLGTDRFTGYTWAVWAPIATGRTELHWLERPLVAKALVAEHKRLARMAFDWAEADDAEAFWRSGKTEPVPW